MSAVGFGFLNFIIVILVVLAILALVAGGIAGLVRGQGGMTRAISIAAIITGVLMLLFMVLGMGLAFVTGVGIFAMLPCFFVLLGAFSFIVWTATLADCAVNEPSQGNDKIVWVIIIVFTHIVGAVLYLAVRRPHRIAETGK